MQICRYLFWWASGSIKMMCFVLGGEALHVLLHCIKDNNKNNLPSEFEQSFSLIAYEVQDVFYSVTDCRNTISERNSFVWNWQIVASCKMESSKISLQDIWKKAKKKEIIVLQFCFLSNLLSYKSTFIYLFPSHMSLFVLFPSLFQTWAHDCLTFPPLQCLLLCVSFWWHQCLGVLLWKPKQCGTEMSLIA